jgi:hypothetical protein
MKQAEFEAVVQDVMNTLPHLELGLPPDKLREEIATTLVHEIAHYFGIDDDHLDDIGWA